MKRPSIARRSWLRGALAAAGALALGATQAHGPTRQKVIEKITIDAAPEAVWALIGPFDALAKWHPAVESSPASAGNGEGSVRTLKLKGGGTLIETLERHSDTTLSYSYRAKDGGALPVTNYSSTISVSAAPQAGQSVVEWRGAFYRGYPNNDPPQEQNDEAALKAVTAVYQSGLANLKALLEKK